MNTAVRIFSDNNLYCAGLFVVFNFMLNILIVAIFVLCGLSLNYPFILALFLSVLVLAFCRYGSLHLPIDFVVVLAYAFIIIAFSLLLSGVFYDSSFDGRIHLQEPIIQLAEGWNSFNTNFKYGDYWWGYRWVNAYPLGIPFYEASVCKVFGMQYAKNHIFLMTGAAFLTLWPCLRRIFPAKTAALVIFTLIFNPCVISQMWTFYIDGFIYLLLLVGIAGLNFFHITTIKSMKYASVAIVSAIIIFYPAFKLSCLMYSGVLFLAYLWLSRRQRQFLIPFVITLPAIVIVCYQPYFNQNIYKALEVGRHVSATALATYLSDMPTAFAFIKNIFYPFPDPRDTHTIWQGFYFKRLYCDYSWGLYSYWWAGIFLLSLGYAVAKIKKYKRFILYIALSIIAPMFVASFINQRYFFFTYLFPFIIFAVLCKDKVLPKSIFIVFNVLLIGHLIFLASGFAFVIRYSIQNTSFIESRLEKLRSNPNDLLYVEFSSSGTPALLREAFSDRLWTAGLDKIVYIPNHAVNSITVEARFEHGESMQKFDDLMVKGFHLDFDGEAGKHMALKVHYKSTAETWTVIYLYINSTPGDFSGNVWLSAYFDKIFIRGARANTDGYALFELPPYTKSIELASDSDKVFFTGVEIREVEINLPEY